MAEHIMNQALMIGVNNRAYIPCLWEASNINTYQWRVANYRISNIGSTNGDIVFMLPLPTVKNTLDLYLDAVKIDLDSADGTNYITNTQVIVLSATGQNTIHTDATDLNTTGSKVQTFTAYNASSYSSVIVYLQTVVATAYALGVLAYLRCYYD